MHAYLIHADIVVSVITRRKGFNADSMEAMMDRSAPVCIVQLQLVSVALSTEKGCTHVCMHYAVVQARAHIHFYINIYFISDCCLHDDTIINISEKN